MFVRMRLCACVRWVVGGVGGIPQITVGPSLTLHPRVRTSPPHPFPSLTLQARRRWRTSWLHCKVRFHPITYYPHILSRANPTPFHRTLNPRWGLPTPTPLYPTQLNDSRVTVGNFASSAQSHPTHPTPRLVHDGDPTHPTPRLVHDGDPTHPTPRLVHDGDPTHPTPGLVHDGDPTHPTPQLVHDGATTTRRPHVRCACGATCGMAPLLHGGPLGLQSPRMPPLLLHP